MTRASLYIIIVGGGKIGYFLARQLLEDQHEVLIIEQNPEKSAQIAEDLGEIVMLGDGCEASTLERAGMGRADMVIALTGDDEDNLVVCQVAKHKFNVPPHDCPHQQPQERAHLQDAGHRRHY